MGAAELCLSRTEIKELTHTPQKARQLQFLRQNGIRHYIDAHGWPVVLRNAVNPEEPKQKSAGWTPNKAA